MPATTTPIKLSEYRNVVILTGAGVSVASGLRPFRGPGGLWTERAEVAPLRAGDLSENPQAIWDFFREMSKAVGAVQPNDAHRAIANAEARFRGQSFTVITQNI